MRELMCLAKKFAELRVNIALQIGAVSVIVLSCLRAMKISQRIYMNYENRNATRSL